jgi:hypothetical protein
VGRLHVGLTSRVWRDAPRDVHRAEEVPTRVKLDVSPSPVRFTSPSQQTSCPGCGLSSGPGALTGLGQSWDTDSCSSLGKVPNLAVGALLGNACGRHDFGYRNHAAIFGRTAEADRAVIDRMLRRDIQAVCGGWRLVITRQSSSCYGSPQAENSAVRTFERAHTGEPNESSAVNPSCACSCDGCRHRGWLSPVQSGRRWSGGLDIPHPSRASPASRSSVRSVSASKQLALAGGSNPHRHSSNVGVHSGG